MAGIDFDDFKKKAADKASELADKTMEYARVAAEHTKLYAKVAKLKTEVAGEKENTKKLYRQLGNMYYNLYKDTPAAGLEQAVKDITASLDHISAKLAEIEDLKVTDADAFYTVEEDSEEETAKEETPEETPAEEAPAEEQPPKEGPPAE